MGKVPFMFYTNGLVFNITLVIINETTQRLKLRLSEGRTNLFALPSVRNFMKCEALIKRLNKKSIIFAPSFLHSIYS